MSFKLGDIVGRTKIDAMALPVIRCPTGKTVFYTKDDARRVIQKTNREKGRRTSMKPFRCSFCEKFHIGHRRGAIL